MIRKIIIVLLTLGAASVVVGGILGSTFGPRVASMGRSFGPYRYATLSFSIPSINVWYQTPNGTEKPAYSHKWCGAGFGVIHVFHADDTLWCSFYHLSCPTWLATLLVGFYPALAFVRWLSLQRPKHRRKRGLCVTCGYDLRGSPERCPECATEIESS